MLAVASLVHAQEFYVVGKNQNFFQTGPGTVIPEPSFPFSFGAGSAKAGTLTIPGGATFPLTFNLRDKNYSFTRSFASKAALDTAFPNGTYTISGPGFATVTITLTGDLYPVAPQVTGGTWNPGGALLLAPNVATTLNFTPFTGYATAGVMGRAYAEFDGVESQTFSRAVPAFGIPASPQPLTSFAIAGNALPNNSAHNGRVEYTTYTMADFTSVNGAVVAQYQTRLDFAATAVASGTGGNPPVFTRQPADQTAIIGSRATFTIAVTSGPAAGQLAFYNWQFNGSYIETNGSDPKYSRATDGSLTINDVALSDAGNYAVLAQNTGGRVYSNVAALTVTAVNAAPTIATQPASQTIAAGSTVVFSVSASGMPAPTYQWRRGTTNITGATASTLVLSGANASASAYTCVVTNSIGNVTSAAANLTVSTVAAADVGRLINLAIRTSAGTGDQTLIVGFATGGAAASGPKPLLIRGVGPALNQFGLTGTLADPVMTVFQGTTTVATNDNWAGDATVLARAAQVGAFGYINAASLDAALALSPALGSYTVQILGKNNGTGIALAEIYDATAAGTFTAATPRLVNVSARTQVGTGDSILFAGFVVGGTTAKTVLIRGIGPTLGVFGVTGALDDPKLQLFSGTTLLRENDNWGGDAQLSTIGTSVGAFTIANAASKDAVLLVTLPPGSYTAQVSGVNNTTGVALVEVYDVP